eukprot:10340290-Prorocentrum_lima.AAC.1
MVSQSDHDPFEVGACGSCMAPVGARSPMMVLCCVWEKQLGSRWLLERVESRGKVLVVFPN